MASPSSFQSRNYKYKVFSSFHGPDVRQTFLAHLRKQFNSNAITMFDDEQRIERSATIAPSLTEAIRESRIAIVILSENYASSSWCLDELLEILECKKAMGQIVMTIFYRVDPSDVRNQKGNFGNVFNETCGRKTDDKREKWSEALTAVGNIAGEHFQNWDNEAKNIEKIAKDVLDKLNFTPSTDFDGMVGLETHLREMKSLLDLDYDGVKMVAIYGPAGIGKTTIARSLQSLLSSKFQLTCFVDNLRESYPKGFDEYGLKLRLQEEFLSKVLNQNGMRICHLGAIKDNLSKQKVLVILDDVNNLKQLEALAGDISWFGSGSRIVVTTENKEILQQHGINNTYHVGFPSYEQARKILCGYAFRQRYPRDGFEKLVERVMELCGKLPLGLRVVGSTLRGKNKKGWEEVIGSLETILDYQDIEEVLRVGYENLNENEQSLFLHIAVFFNGKDGDLVKAMFANRSWNVERGLKILVNRSLIEISTYGERIEMHKLLQQVGRQAIRRQEPWKCQILIDAREICNILEYGKDLSNVSGISFDISDIDGVSISESAFQRMPNLRFLRVYNSKDVGNGIVDIPKGMDLPCRLRLLQWEAYPSKSFPPRFHPEYLVELDMKNSQLEMMWEGIQPLSSLKKMDLSGSCHLKELPDLSKATNLETLELSNCNSLVEIPSSFSNLHKLKDLWMFFCTRLAFIPTNCNLASLEKLNMTGCSRLQNFPCISTNISRLDISGTSIQEVPASIKLWSKLQNLGIRGVKLMTLPQLPTNITTLDLSYSDIETICSIKGFQALNELRLHGCKKLTSLPELPLSLNYLLAQDCESLETVFFPFDVPNAQLNFTNCFKLRQEARREIIQQRSFGDWGTSFLPGKKLPAQFHQHRAKGNILSFPFSAFSSFKVCLVISPNQQTKEYEGAFDPEVYCHWIGKGYKYPIEEIQFWDIPETRHLFIFHSDRFFDETWFEESGEIGFRFSSKHPNFDIIECGVQILTCQTKQSNNNHQDMLESYEFNITEEEEDNDNITKEEEEEEEEEEVYCHCSRPAILLQAWTDENPGRRFYECNGRSTESCEFFQWLDEEKPHGWQKMALREARDVINELDEEMKRLSNLVEHVNQENGRVDSEECKIVDPEILVETETKNQLNVDIAMWDEKEKILRQFLVISWVGFVVVVAVIVNCLKN